MLTFSPDGKLLAAGVYAQARDDKADYTVRVWESATQREIMRYMVDETPQGLLAISPDNRLLAHFVYLPPKQSPILDDVLRAPPSFPVLRSATVRWPSWCAIFRPLKSTTATRLDVPSAATSGRSPAWLFRPTASSSRPAAAIRSSMSGALSISSNGPRCPTSKATSPTIGRASPIRMQGKHIAQWPELGAQADGDDCSAAQASEARKGCR